MGLFDCWTFALSSAANNYATAAGSAAMPTPLVRLPDIIIAVAICREYRAAQIKADTKRWEYALMMMAELGFRVYDSHLKKGTVTRDTMHRFLSDVHGDDSYKTTGVRRVLDHLMNPEGSVRTMPSIGPSQFTSGIMKYTTIATKSHILLDWLSVFGCQMIPSNSLPPSTLAYLETLQLSNRSIEDLCETYNLGNLYEIKRRFHSLVEHSQVLHGDVMVENADDSPKPKKRHVISMNAFFQGVSMENEEGGHGGFLPRSLAAMVFQTGSSSVDINENSNSNGNVNESDINNYAWGLYDVLQFGVDAVRQSKKQKGDVMVELPLLRFAFRIFGGSQDSTGNRMMSRPQVSKMILLLLEHTAFRLQADSPRAMDDEEPIKEPFILNEENIENTLIDITAASLLGILPKLDGQNGPSTVTLNKLVEFCLQIAKAGDDGLTFDGFCRWHYHCGSSDLGISHRRVGPFLTDLRLIASITFGIPPSKASMELNLMEEVQRRHKYRFPQTDVARRGPRGTVWYIMDDRWFRQWVAHVKSVGGTEKDAADGTIEGSARGLGKINNADLLADNGSLALRSDIRWRTDYEIIPPMAWSGLQAWYDGGPPISRSVVRYVPTSGAPSPHSTSPRVRTEYEIELYPFYVSVFLCDATSRGEARPFQQSSPVSRVSPVRVLLIQLCKGLVTDPKYGRLWMIENNVDAKVDDWLLNLDENIVEQRTRRGIISDSTMNITLLLELKDLESALWPRGLDGKNWIFKNKSKDVPGETSQTGDGIVGLYNMGNTCYLNSSVQCLSHTPVFREYFTTKAYLNDINTTNPIGYQGRLAQVSAVLINSLWKRFNQTTPHYQKRITAPGSYAPVNAPALTPKTFKEALGKCNELFAGNEQHDAQELLAFLLGGLSEDLNRIVEKPYIEAPDSDGRPDSELADIWWTNHLRREMSIIVSMFTGQYKSLLTCRSCKYESARFEPFTFLQLPLPEDDQISMALIYYPLGETTEALKYSVRVNHDGTLADVLAALSKVIYSDSIGYDNSEYFKGFAKRDEAPRDSFEEEQEEGQNAELDSIYMKMSQNMAVVDLREGYIFKIAPNSWALSDLQNKDTGELPLLHIYELDPMADRLEPNIDLGTPLIKKDCEEFEESGGHEVEDEAIAEGDDEEETDDDEEYEDEDSTENEEFESSKNIEEEEEPLQDEDINNDESKLSPSAAIKYSFLAVAQRKSEVTSLDLLHPFIHSVFGTPMLLRVCDLEGFSGRDLYDLIAQRLRKFVHKSALRFLEGSERSAESRNDSLPVSATHGTRHRRRRTLSEMEEVAAGPMPRYGFRIRLTSRDGRRCALCPWYQCCIGCLVPDDDYPAIVMCGDTISLDWHFAVDIATAGFGARLNKPDQPVPTSPFRSKNHSSINIKNHNSCNDEAKKRGYGGTITLEDCLDAFAKEEKIPEAYCSNCKDFRVQTKRMSLWRLPPVVIIHLKRFQFTQHMRRKLRDLVVFPVEGLDLSRIVAADTCPLHDDHEINEKAQTKKGKTTRRSMSDDSDEDDSTTVATGDNESSAPMGPFNSTGRTVMLYDLYAVVHHQGALSGGHYVASLKSDDGQWRLFNDAQVYEIHSRDVVDSSAYILFYIRRDVKDANLQDFWDLRKREGKGLTEEEVEKLMKAKGDRCVIS